MNWTPTIVTQRINRFHVVMCSPNGKERIEVMILAPNLESAEEHAKAQRPTMHIVDSWEANV